jgi:hypothetical protein
MKESFFIVNCWLIGEELKHQRQQHSPVMVFEK